MGRPKGSKNNPDKKRWEIALRRASLEYANGKSGPRNIDVAARAVVQSIKDGKMAAVSEFGDRLDGKVAQALTGADDGPIRIIARIERTIVKP